MAVVETKDVFLFWKPPCVFSQWTKSEFKVDGQTYSTAEQFMMAEKAMLFKDLETREKILHTHDPKKQKALGRQVKHFNETIWQNKCVGIVTRGNLAKFSQNPEMRKVLFETGDKILAEASPFDRGWGIGMAATNPDALDHKKWRGKNLLGMVLMIVRSKLRNGEEGPPRKMVKTDEEEE